MLPDSNTTWASCSTSVYLSKMLSRNYTLFARLPLSNSSFVGLLVSAACSLLSHSTDCQHTDSRIANPSIVTFQTSLTTCLHCTCWRQQQKFIGAVKLADKNSSHPPHVQLSSILRMVSPQSHFSKWYNFSSALTQISHHTRNGQCVASWD